MNRGYIGYSMSVRAAEAYQSGEKPLSKWSKSDILAAVKAAYGAAARHLRATGNSFIIDPAET